MKLFYSLSILCGLLLIQSCAQISAPTGGAPDTTPPILDSLGTIPLNYSTHFKGDKLTLTFNEYFVLKNPKQNVFFSPSIENEPEFLVKGKTLTILLNHTLRTNTTYTINFGDAISDYSVGNAIPDFKYVFSTGNFIDSMSTTGKVIDAFSGTPKPNVLVMLYENTTDSVVSLQRPDYYAITNKEGSYSLTNLKTGTYKLFALKDENRNFLYDLPNEQVASPDSLVSLFLDTLSSYHLLSLFAKDFVKQSVTSKKYEYPGKLTLTFAKPVKNWNVAYTDSLDLGFIKSEINEEKDSLVLWGVELANQKTKLTVKLDTHTSVINVYKYKIPSKEIELSKTKSDRSIHSKSALSIIFNNALSKVNRDLISVLKDSSFIPIDSVSLATKTLNVYFPKSEDQDYRYRLLPQSVEDIFGNKLKDTLEGLISINKTSFYGSFTLNILPKNDSVQYILYLVNEKGEKVGTQNFMGVSTVSFSQLNPGKYKLKALEDRNKNGRWDTGDYYLKKKPEQVFYFPIEIDIRSNWEIAESWEF